MPPRRIAPRQSPSNDIGVKAELDRLDSARIDEKNNEL
jgi:hypothetical protein